LVEAVKIHLPTRLALVGEDEKGEPTMSQLVNVKKDGAPTPAPQTTPEEKARPRVLRMEALENRLAPQSWFDVIG
jgi:hypothetical protein